MPAIVKNKPHVSGKRLNLNSKESISKNFRIYTLVFLIVTIVAIVVLRLYFLQVVRFESFKALAKNQHNLSKILVPERGEIFLKDKDGIYAAAVNKETKLVYVVSKEIENQQEVVSFLADALQMDRAELFEKTKNSEDMYELVKHRLSDEEIKKIQDAKLKGVHLADETFRYYPSAELAANVLGFVGWNGDKALGQYGVEAYFEKELKGTEGNLEQNTDTAGRWISIGERNLVSAKNGNNLVLTIDHIVQYETEKLLKSAIEKYDAEDGSIIVMDPQTGKILAMANYPTFNPNNYSQVDDMNVFRNLAVSEPYECGSVFKAITMAAAIDDGKVNPETTYVDTGAVTEAGYTIRNSDLKSNGRQTMTQVLEKSLNTGAIFAEKILGNQNFYDYVKRFGFGDTTGIGLSGESPGNIGNLKNLKSNIQYFTASFGQGITVTPIQLLSAYNAIANGGVLMRPQIVDKIIYSDGTEEEIKPMEVRQVISQQADGQISQMLRSVVVKGHGKMADVPGYQVAGKTGTAQVASTEKKGYEEGKKIGSFAGFAPMDNPRFSILVKMDNPKNVEWAESSAAPTFGELMKFLLEYYKIEPTEKYTQKDLDIFNQNHKLKDLFLQNENNLEKNGGIKNNPGATNNEKNEKR